MCRAARRIQLPCGKSSRNPAAALSRLTGFCSSSRSASPPFPFPSPCLAAQNSHHQSEDADANCNLHSHCTAAQKTGGWRMQPTLSGLLLCETSQARLRYVARLEMRPASAGSAGASVSVLPAGRLSSLAASRRLAAALSMQARLVFAASPLPVDFIEECCLFRSSVSFFTYQRRAGLAATRWHSCDGSAYSTGALLYSSLCC